MPEPTAEDRALFAQYHDAAVTTAQMMVDACVRNDGEAGGSITRQIFERNDLTFTMLVLGQLATRVAAAEHAQAGGPKITLEDPRSHKEIWHTSALDQLMGAFEHGDYKTFAVLALDAELRALNDDKGEFDVDFDHVLRALVRLDHTSLLLIAVDALLRLGGERGSRG